MKKFCKPVFEIVRFEKNVIATSACGCFDEMFPEMATDCVGDVAYCECTINTNPAIANCCYTYEA